MTDQASKSELQLTLNELRQNTFNLLLVFISLSTATLMWLANLKVRSSAPEVLLIWLGVEAVCAISFWLRKKHLRIAMSFFLVGLWICNAFAAQYSGLLIFLYLFSLISLAASVLTNRLAAFVTTSASTIFILVWYGANAANNDMILSLLMLWSTLLTGFIAFQSFYSALGIALSYQHYAIEQMFEAREHRGNLMQTTKTLNEVRQDLERTNTQLYHARKAAEEAGRLKAQFAANVSHELRTPINLIVGFSETIVMSPDSYGVPLPSVYWADMHTIHRSAKHLQSLINDVLDVSQIEAGQMSVVKEEINPRQIILEAATLAKDLIASRGLAFHVIVPEHLPTMLLDRTRIRQVLLNLLSNAARFTDEGTITLQTTLEEASLRIDVIDTGIGIPAKDLNRVFDEFHQLEGSLSRRKGGSGLGLTLSKRFAELHGGRLSAESSGILGKGSTFSLRLPLIDHSIMQHLSIGSATEQDEHIGKYFVVLDADPAIRQLFERYTTKHHAVGVETTTDALRLIETIRPTAVVVDEHENYDALLQTLRGTGNQTPVIACTMPSGRRSMPMVTRANYFLKHVSSETLRIAIEDLNPLAKHILIIDSDQDVVRMFTRMLNALPQQFKMWKAYNSEEGLALMQQQCPDIVILGLPISANQGDFILQQMQAAPTLAEIPVIVTATDSSVDDLIPTDTGRIVVGKVTGFKPLELVRSVEALIDVFMPANEPAPLTNPLG